MCQLVNGEYGNTGGHPGRGLTESGWSVLFRSGIAAMERSPDEGSNEAEVEDAGRDRHYSDDRDDPSQRPADGSQPDEDQDDAGNNACQPSGGASHEACEAHLHVPFRYSPDAIINPRRPNHPRNVDRSQLNIRN